MNTDINAPEFDPKKFLEDLKQENAEALKARILKRVEETLRTAGAPPERLREIGIWLLPDSR